MAGGRVVADASVLVKWVVPEDYSGEASRMRDDHLDGVIRVHTPDLALLEVASALRKYAARGLLTRDQAAEALSLIAEADVAFERVDAGLALEALRLSMDLGVTVYDAAYIALAVRLKAVFYTTDERLLGNPNVKKLAIARHIRDYASNTGTGVHSP